MVTDANLKRKLLIVAAACAVICASSLYYVLKKYEIKNYKAGLASLASDIFEKSAAKKFSGTIAEVKTLSGPESDKYLEEALLPELNIQLLSNPKALYTTIIDPSEYENQIKSLRAELQARGVADDTIAEIVMRKAKPAKKAADYSTAFSWSWTEKDKGYLQVMFKISTVEFIESKVVITHPLYEKSYLSIKHFLTVVAWVSGAFAVGAFILFLILLITYKFRSNKAFTSLPALKEKATEFVNNGQFSAALNEINHYLVYLPENSELIAFKNQLLVKTKGNPAKAEEAYNKLGFIRRKLEGRGLDKINDKDLEDLRMIADSIEVENVGAIIGRIEGQLHSKIAGAQITAARARAKALIENGRPTEAVRELEKAQQDPALNEYIRLLASMDESARLALPAPDSLKSIHVDAEEIIRTSQANLTEAKDLLNHGEVARADELFENAFRDNRELTEAEELLSKLEKSRKTERLVLTPEKIGKKVFIFKKDVITIFRRDFKEPDIEINSKTVSRDAHLKIAVVGDKVLAEDQNSSVGTRIGGQELKGAGSKLEINDGDILDFNGAYRMTAHICRGGGGGCGAPTVLGTTEVSTAPRPESAESKNIGSVVFEGEDDRNFIMLLESSPVAFKSIGLVYEKAGDCSICVKDGVILLLASDYTEILYSGVKIEYKGIRYRS